MLLQHTLLKLSLLLKSHIKHGMAVLVAKARRRIFNFIDSNTTLDAFLQTLVNESLTSHKK